MDIHICITFTASLWQWDMKRGKLNEIWKLVSIWDNWKGRHSLSCQWKLLTGWSVRLIPIRKSSSATKRLMQRFLWMVLRSLWSPRKKQNVKMQIRRQTRDSKIPTHVITSRRRSWTASLCWKHNRKAISCIYA